MPPTEVVPSEKERQRRPQVFPLLAKAKREAYESAHEGTDIEILPFNVRSTDAALIRLTKNGLSYYSYNLWRRITMVGVLRRRVNLDELREVYLFMLKLTDDCITILSKAVRCDLQLIIISRGRKLLGKLPGIFARSSPKM